MDFTDLIDAGWERTIYSFNSSEIGSPYPEVCVLKVINV